MILKSVSREIYAIYSANNESDMKAFKRERIDSKLQSRYCLKIIVQFIVICIIKLKQET